MSTSLVQKTIFHIEFACYIKVVNAGVTQFTQCQYLACIRQLVGKDANQQQWKILFTRFARVLMAVVRSPKAVSSLIQFMYEFHHWIVCQGHCNPVNAFVVKTPNASGALLMDFNKNTNLRGKRHWPAYKKFYKHFIMADNNNDGEPISMAKLYVSYAQVQQRYLDVLLDIFEVCKREGANPLTVPNLTLMVTNLKDYQFFCSKATMMPVPYYRI
jgi:hypothetical protein